MKILAIIVEIVGIAMVGTGIGVELIAGAHIGMIIITIGSCLVAAGGVIWGKFLRKEE